MELTAKIFGWVLLLLGVAIIGWTLYSSYNIFTAKVAPPAFFEMPKEAVKIPAATGIQDIQEQIGTIIGEQLKGFLPVDTLPKILNLLVWSILAGLLIFGGGQISNLGIKLIKK